MWDDAPNPGHRDLRLCVGEPANRIMFLMVEDPMAGDVVVGVDGSAPSSTALVWALGEARRRGADLRILRVFHPVDVHRDALTAGVVEGEVDTQFKAALAGAEAGVAVKVEAIAGSPVHELLKAAEMAGVLVVGTRGLGGFAELLVGSVSEQCVRHSLAPVVVVREAAAPGGRFVVGVDGSPNAVAALRWTIGEARLARSEVEALHAWTYPAAFRHGEAVFPYEALQAHATHVLEAALRETGEAPDVRVVPRLMQAGAAAALVEASRGAALVVVGSRGRGGFTGMVLGSVSQTCVRHVECPVAVVPEGWAARP